MSDEIKHECGLAFIRLRKPFSYYQQEYGSVMYGLNKLYLLMENNIIGARMAQASQPLNLIQSPVTLFFTG